MYSAAHRHKCVPDLGVGSPRVVLADSAVGVEEIEAAIG
jgi:hypothetical protein